MNTRPPFFQWPVNPVASRGFAAEGAPPAVDRRVIDTQEPRVTGNGDIRIVRL